MAKISVRQTQNPMVFFLRPFIVPIRMKRGPCLAVVDDDSIRPVI